MEFASTPCNTQYQEHEEVINIAEDDFNTHGPFHIFASETIGMFVFIYCAITSVNYYVLSGTANCMIIPICFGLSLTAGVYMCKHSGGHLNPAVSVAKFLLDKDITTTELVAYILGQGVGSILAGLLVVIQFSSWINNFEDYENNVKFVGMYGTLRSMNVSLFSAIIDQFVGSFGLMYGICFIPDSKFKPVFVGLLLCALGFMFQLNGFAFNGWRDMGPRIASSVMFGDLVFSAHDYWFWVPLVIPFPAMIVAELCFINLN